MANNSWNTPRLMKPIQEDVPHMQEKLAALLKQDPTSIEDVPVGAKRLFETSAGNWQLQQFNGESWEAVKKLVHDADTVDSYHAAITPNANTIAVRGADKKLQGDITGNAATATSATTLSQTLPINKGGTGATTSAAARTNLGAAPVAHASSAGTYGLATDTNYGHVRSDGTTTKILAGEVVVKDIAIGGDTADTASLRGQIGECAPVRNVSTDDFNDLVKSGAYWFGNRDIPKYANKPSSLGGVLLVYAAAGNNYVQQIYHEYTGAHVYKRTCNNRTWSGWIYVIFSNNYASASIAGIVRPSTGLTIDAEGLLKVALNNTVTSTSTAQAATAKAVKTAYDKAIAAYDNSVRIATTSAAGIVRPSTGLTIDAAGLLKVALVNAVNSTSTTRAATANAAKVAYDKAVQALNKANTATAKAYITATWRSGNNWYRKWSDGFIEQGGYPRITRKGSHEGYVLSLLTPFTNAGYSFVAIAESADNSYFMNDNVNFRNADKTKTSIRLVTEQGGTYYICWYACGY